VSAREWVHRVVVACSRPLAAASVCESHSAAVTQNMTNSHIELLRYQFSHQESTL